MSPALFSEVQQSLFRVASPTLCRFAGIDSILVRVTVANTLNTPSSIHHSIVEAGKNSLLGGKTFKIDVERALYTIQSVRWRIRRVLLRWLYKRLVPCTTDDLFTLEPIRQPIHIVVWKSRHIYSFEVKTLHSAVVHSLLHTSGMFAIPLRPKNPLTNLSLSLGQVISVWNSFASAQFPLSPVVAQYRSVQYDHQRFIEEYATSLSVSSMKRCIMNPLDLDGADCLLDFIESAYEYNGITLNAQSKVRMESDLFMHKNNYFLRRFRIKCVEYNYVLLVKKNYSAAEILQELYSIYRSCMPIIKNPSGEIKAGIL